MYFFLSLGATSSLRDCYAHSFEEKKLKSEQKSNCQVMSEEFDEIFRF